MRGLGRRCGATRYRIIRFKRGRGQDLREKIRGGEGQNIHERSRK